MVFRLKLKSCLFALLGSAILAFGLYNIHSLSVVTEGGILGFSLLLEHWFGISPAISALILNAVCYVVGWRSLGRDFLGYSIFAGGGFSLFYAICEMFPPLFPQIAEHPGTAAILGAIFVGVGVGISVRSGGAPSGDDALAMSLSQSLKIDIRWIYLVSDVSVLALSLTYIPHLTIFYSLLTVILSGAIISVITNAGKNNTANEARDVLVGTLRNAAQLNICLAHNFYHIPTARLSAKNSPIRYVAIYQSRSVFGENCGIQYFGEVESCRLVPRHKIAEIPSTSRELYYRFTIKEWLKLPQTIKPCEGGFVNLTTTLFLLKNSRNMLELTLRSSKEFDIYRSIFKGLDGEVTHIRSGKVEITSTPTEIKVSKNGRNVFFCTAEDFRNNTSAMFKYIQNELDI